MLSFTISMYDLVPMPKPALVIYDGHSTTDAYHMRVNYCCNIRLFINLNEILSYYYFSCEDSLYAMSFNQCVCFTAGAKTHSANL
jgi:hypothetical protein